MAALGFGISLRKMLLGRVDEPLNWSCLQVLAALEEDGDGKVDLQEPFSSFSMSEKLDVDSFG